MSFKCPWFVGNILKNMLFYSLSYNVSMFSHHVALLAWSVGPVAPLPPRSTSMATHVAVLLAAKGH